MPGRRWRLAAFLPAIAIVVATAITVQVLLLGYGAGGTVLAANEEESDWELWALDQGEGINRIHIYGPDLEERAVITFADLDAPHNTVRTPHMISFDITNQYAVVASTGSGTTTVIRTEDYEVIETLETGPGTHMALFTFDNDAIWTANIGAKSLTRIDVDLDQERFEVAEQIDLIANLQAEGWEGWQEAFGDDLDDWPGPVCHAFTPGGEFMYVSLGPMAGGMVVVETATGEIVQAFDPREVKANCGLALNSEQGEMFANWSGPPHGVDHPDEGQPGEWYVFDFETHEHLATYTVNAGSNTMGLDPHGVLISPDGDEFWQLNRLSNDGVIIDPVTHEVIDEVTLSDTPDVLAFSPDGDLVFVALRGPNPVSMPHVAVGGTPGFEVLDAATRQSIQIVQPASEDELEFSDFHAVGVRGPINPERTLEDLMARAEERSALAPATGGANTGHDVLLTLLVVFAVGALGIGAWLRRRPLHFRLR